MSCCKKCCIPINQDFEFPINNNILTVNDKISININDDYTDIELLKNKIICDYQKLLTELYKGKKVYFSTNSNNITAMVHSGKIKFLLYVVSDGSSKYGDGLVYIKTKYWKSCDC